VLTEEEKSSIGSLLSRLHGSIETSSPNFRSAKFKVDQLSDLFDNIKGIRKQTAKILKVEFQNLRDALSEKDADRALDVFDRILIMSRTSLGIKLNIYRKPFPIYPRVYE